MGRYGNDFGWRGKYADYRELCNVKTGADQIGVYVNNSAVVVRSALRDVIYAGSVKAVNKVSVILTCACHDWGVLYNNQVIATIPGAYARRELPPLYNAPHTTVMRMDVSGDIKTQIRLALLTLRTYANGHKAVG